MTTNQQAAVVSMGAEHMQTNRRSAITASNLIRLAGIATMLAGLLFIVVQMIHPADIISSVGTGRWAIVHYLGVAMCFLGLLGITGIYARQVDKAGWLGLAGYLLVCMFYALTMAFQFIEAFVSPPLAAESPIYVEGLLGIPSGNVGDINVGSLETIYSATGIMYLLGGLLFGIATFRAGILSRRASALLAIGTLLPLPLSSLIHHPYDRILAVPVGLSLVWLGYSAWSKRHA
ncbi:hypothetical protein [Paenibacillus cymbidii]|uniref:hypothetical protein n=1 Tax=Paenibacillus cymbidii TaxID=1639034 RepID=UPI001F2AA36C|nr:hypothetical protein [Paenibacillus cymbidii]